MRRLRIVLFLAAGVAWLIALLGVVLLIACWKLSSSQ